MSRILKVALLVMLILQSYTAIANSQDADLEKIAVVPQKSSQLNTQQLIKVDGEEGSPKSFLYKYMLKFIPTLVMTWAGCKLVNSNIIQASTVSFFHELGHYLMVKSFGLSVNEFVINLDAESSEPRTIFKKKVFGDTFKIIKSHNKTSAVSWKWQETQSGSAHELRRLSIAAAGPMMNCVMAIGLTALGAMWIGKPATSPVITEVIPGSFLDKAQVLPGDRVVAINNTPVESAEEVLQLMAKAGSQFKIIVRRNNTLLEVNVSGYTPQNWSPKNLIRWMIVPLVIEEEHRLGIQISQRSFKRLGLGDAINFAFSEFKSLLRFSSAEKYALLPRHENDFWRTTNFTVAELGHWFLSSLAYIHVQQILSNLIPRADNTGGSDGFQVLSSLYSLCTSKTDKDFMEIYKRYPSFIEGCERYLRLAKNLLNPLKNLLNPLCMVETIVYSTSGLSDVNESAHVSFRRGINI
jgi:hypothetical protein